MVYLDDKLAGHPKLAAAGEIIGENGVALALALYVGGLMYSRGHLTNGFIPSPHVPLLVPMAVPQQVAAALADPGVGLWSKVKGGYQIHDYLDWNDDANQIKALRERARLKKARQRAKHNGRIVPRGRPPGTSKGTVRGTHARTSHDPSRRKIPVLGTVIQVAPSQQIRTTRKNLRNTAALRAAIFAFCSHEEKTGGQNGGIVTEADRIPAAVRDSAGRDPERPGTGRPRMVTSREMRSAGIGLHVPRPVGSVHACDAGHGNRVNPRMGPAAVPPPAGPSRHPAIGGPGRSGRGSAHVRPAAAARHSPGRRDARGAAGDCPGGIPRSGGTGHPGPRTAAARLDGHATGGREFRSRMGGPVLAAGTAAA